MATTWTEGVAVFGRLMAQDRPGAVYWSIYLSDWLGKDLQLMDRPFSTLPREQMTTDLTPIRKWYSGKGLKILDEYVLPTLAAAEAQGYWPPGAARKIRAALNKQTVANKFARANERRRDVSGNQHQDGDQGLLDDIAACRGDRHFEAKLRGWDLLFAMEFGAYEKAPKLRDLAGKLRPYAQGPAEQAALDRAAEWVRNFIPVAELVLRLDESRPPPEYVFAEVSPAVYANVGKALEIDFTTVRAPNIIWPKEAVMPITDWPEGTRHGVSRFARGSTTGTGYALCEACGHAIKRNNWVPLVADTAAGPVSLWVGRDCAATLFGAKITGDTKIPREVQK